MEKSLGHRFQPSDYELLMILFRFVTGMGCYDDAKNVIRHEDIYGDKEPWELFHWDLDEKFHYFFTQLKRKSKASSSLRFARRVGKSLGTWHGQDKGKPIIHKRTGALLGYKRSFVYRNKEEPEQDRQWLLKEFYLSDAVMKKATEMYPILEHTKDFVLCRLQRKKRAGSEAQESKDVPLETILQILLQGAADSTATAMENLPTIVEKIDSYYYINPKEEILAQPAVVQQSMQGENIDIMGCLLFDGGILNEDSQFNFSRCLHRQTPFRLRHLSSSGALGLPFPPLSLSASGDHGSSGDQQFSRRQQETTTVAMAASSSLWRSLFPGRAVTTGRKGSAAVPFSLFPVSRRGSMVAGLAHRVAVRRDIKCANICVDAAGRVKLADFGLAKATKLNDVSSVRALPSRWLLRHPPPWSALMVASNKGPAGSCKSLQYILAGQVAQVLPGQGPKSPLLGIRSTLEQDSQYGLHGNILDFLRFITTRSLFFFGAYTGRNLGIFHIRIRLRNGIIEIKLFEKPLPILLRFQFVLVPGLFPTVRSILDPFIVFNFLFS
nr:NAC domain-containing protein 78-like [Ipomoea batatas]